MAIETITAALAAIEATITGLSAGRCFDQTPSSIDISPPFVLNVIESGTILRSAGQGSRETTHTIKVHLAVADQSDLRVAEKAARPYINRFIDKMDQNKTISGTCVVSEVTGYRYGPIQLHEGDAGYLGIIFDLDCTEQEDVVFAA